MTDRIPDTDPAPPSQTATADIITTRAAFIGLFPTLDEAIAAEDAVLNAVVGQTEALQCPDTVERVLGGHDAADDDASYWGWLAEQVEVQS